MCGPDHRIADTNVRRGRDVAPVGGRGKGKEDATESSFIWRQGAVLTLIVLIAAGIATSISAVLPVPWPAPRTGSRARSNLPLLLAGVLALGAILLAIHIQLGAFR
jgi:hypothetical protein